MLANQEQINFGNKRHQTSISLSKKPSPSTMEQAISMLRKQLRQCKVQREEQRQEHRVEVSNYQKQIDSLKQKILQMKQKQYLKTILSDEAEQEKVKQVTLANAHKKLKLYAEKLENDLKQKQQIIERLNQQNLDLKNDKQILQREKQKHLELSIIEKINLEERMQVLEKQVQSKQNMLNALRSQSSEFTNKQITLKKLQRKLVKKVNEVEQYQDELKNFKQFETQKLKTRIETLQQQNCFLKQHIAKIEQQFALANECSCSNSECKRQIELFKNKFITKSRELSKVKVQLSKEMFKEQFLKQIKNKENIQLEDITVNNKFSKSKDKTKPRFDYGLTNTKQQSNPRQQVDDILLFKLTEQDEQQNKTLKNAQFLGEPSKYKSEMLRKYKPNIITAEYR